jgi:hypothetical protein
VSFGKEHNMTVVHDYCILVSGDQAMSQASKMWWHKQAQLLSTVQSTDATVQSTDATLTRDYIAHNAECLYTYTSAAQHCKSYMKLDVLSGF